VPPLIQYRLLKIREGSPEGIRVTIALTETEEREHCGDDSQELSVSVHHISNSVENAHQTKSVRVIMTETLRR